jgi:uncharacterized membrane protein (DUF106 family)
MTRFPKLYKLLTGQDPLSKAQQRARDAQQRMIQAEQRGDDRDYGRARMELTQAQHERLWRGE